MFLKCFNNIICNMFIKRPLHPKTSHATPKLIMYWPYCFI